MPEVLLSAVPSVLAVVLLVRLVPRVRAMLAPSSPTADLPANRLSDAVESMQDAFALFDDRDYLVLCNSAYRQLIGDTLPGPLIGS